jgi:hypothetical protein
MKKALIILFILSPFGAFAAETQAVSTAELQNSCRKVGIPSARCENLIKALTSQKPAERKTSRAAAPASPTRPASLPPNISTAMKDQIKTWGCDVAQKALFIRSDPLDNFNYLLNTAPDTASSPPASSQSKGASVAYTDDLGASTEKAVINGRVSYLIFGIKNCSFLAPAITLNTGVSTFDPNSLYIQGVGLAPFVSSNGTWNNPFTTTTVVTTLPNKRTSPGTTATIASDSVTTKTIVINKGSTVTTTTSKTSTSAIRLGLDFQANVHSPILTSENFFYASPFYQTDYRNLAQIGGVDVRYEPVYYNPYAPILGVNEGYIDNNISYITQFTAEAEFTHVANPGYTALTKGEHAWLGETARPNLVLFPAGPNQYSDDWFNNWIAGRISLIGTQQFYWDADSRRTANYYSAILQYKLGACTVSKDNPDRDRACETSGSSAIALEYDTGRDKDTNLRVNQWLVKLSFAY